MLHAADKNVLLAGNLGVPILDYIDEINEYDYVIYELSSFQLEALQDFSLDIGVFTALYRTHTREHG
jgi:UDP-N-acetylmuramoylalanine--D-glutamate ligase